MVEITNSKPCSNLQEIYHTFLMTFLIIHSIIKTFLQSQDHYFLTFKT